MNRLWVRLSLMIGGVLFFVFLLQFVSIITSSSRPDVEMINGMPGIEPDFGQESKEEIARRLVNFGLLSIVVGFGGGIVISQVVSQPISRVVNAAHQIGIGDLSARVPVRGSQEMKDLAETFNIMAQDLQHAETLRSNLMADVSHELRTPLTVLEGNLRAVLDHVYTLDEAEIANLYGQTRHLIRLVNDLRELALAEAGQLSLEKQPVDLKNLAVEVLQAIEPLAVEKGVHLVDQVPQLPEISLDPIRIRQVLFNLLTNSIRHTPAGGEIIVKAENRTGSVRLAITDNGEGLEKDQLAVVFDRFYRIDKSRSREMGGSGLGLAIVKAIIEAHGGHVEAHSAGKGLGSSFVISLPAEQ